jgi:phosphatidylserine decarboxylase
MSGFFILLQYLLPQHLLSRIVGKFAESKRLKNPLIRLFIKRYKVDLSQAVIQDINAFENFNAFFTRELKPDARPLAKNANAIVCPADGTLSQLGNIKENQLLQAKGRHYSCEDLLGGDLKMAELFRGGSFATVYLSPRDYHRVHMPLSGTLLRTIYIPGKLFSVNQVTANSVPNLFARNERLVCLFQTELGPMAIALVGAMIVAGIDTIWSGQVCPTGAKRKIHAIDYTGRHPAIDLAQGAEMGKFRLGSTAIILFPHGAMEFDSSLQATSSVAMGQLLGQVKPPSAMNTNEDKHDSR